MLRVSVLPYDPAWPEHYERIKASILPFFSKIPDVTFEHVGSTAVPGLAAKPIIDIDIIVPPLHYAQAASALSYAGYVFKPEPQGIDRMSYRYIAHALDSGASLPTEDGDIRRAIYLVMPFHVSYLNHLAVRQVLRKDADLREEYGQLKLALAKEEFTGIGEYGSRKTDILKRIMSRSDLEHEYNPWRVAVKLDPHKES